MSREQHVDVSRIYRKQSLYANVTLACRYCGAPGYWHNTPNVNVGCYAPEKVTKLGEDPVGPLCPCCGNDRPAVEHHGEIWSKTWRTSLRSALKNALVDLLKPLRRQQ